MKTIPNILIKTYKNQTKITHKLKYNHNTIKKYINNKNKKIHTIINNILIIHHK
ncbi:protein ninH [Escherichia coli]|uniref:protein ninH n=1 Tax=Escherichia coli TaxID=562 RepID=UPI00390C54F0